MLMKSKLTAFALLSFVATTAMATTNANAYHLRIPACTWSSLEACGAYYLEQQPTTRRTVVRVDTSPNYIKQTDPRYNSTLSDAGGGGR